MSEIAISVENLSKLYLLGQAERKHESLLSELGGLLASPFRNFRELRRLDTSRAGGNGQAESPDLLWALKDVSFEVKQGEVLGVIGRNGAGKSTLLKILSRITEPTSGRVRIRGRVASLLEVGTGFHPELTGRENVYLNGTILGMNRREIDRKFDEIVDFSGVERFLDTPVKRYSSGMKVRLGFAVAASLLPDILIVDEVLAVGDADFQQKCISKMRDTVRQGDRTVLFVSHSLSLVNVLCSRVIWMVEGRPVRDGQPGEVIESYLATQAQATQNVFDLGLVDRPVPEVPRLRLTGLRFNGGDYLRHGCPLVAEIAYETFMPLDGIGFALALRSPDGGRIMTFISDIPGRRYSLPGGRRGVMTLRLDTLHLQPGRYFLDLGARAGDDVTLDMLKSFAQVEIRAGEDTHPLLVGREINSGVIQPAEWSLDTSGAGWDDAVAESSSPLRPVPVP